jgi:hypothetical protein
MLPSDPAFPSVWPTILGAVNGDAMRPPLSSDDEFAEYDTTTAKRVKI